MNDTTTIRPLQDVLDEHVVAVTARRAAASRVATLLLDADDHVVVLEVMQPALRDAGIWDDVCLILEVCPTHFCDVQTCRDGEADCQNDRDVDERVATMLRRLEQAAKRLNPLVIDPANVSAADLYEIAHDTLGDLTAIRLQIDLMEQDR